MTDRVAPPRLAPGDLVCMWARKEKGLGVLIRYVATIEDCIGMDPATVLTEYRSYTTKEWRKRDLYRKRICAQADDPDLAFDFFVYNIAFEDTLKVSFAEVQWLKPPSTFNVEGTSAKRGWFPASWIRKHADNSMT